MLKLYFKQAIALIKQNKLFSGLYILGSALAIASVTILAVVIYLSVAPIYPDTNRENVYYLSISAFNEKNGKSRFVSGYSYKAVNEWFYSLKNAKVVSAEFGRGIPFEIKQNYKNYVFNGVYADANFFKIYKYRFIAGSPFSETDFEGKLKKVVMSDRTARKLFGTEDGAIGKSVKMRGHNYTVCGIFEQPSIIAGESYAELIVPYTTYDGYMYEDDVLLWYGSYRLRFLVEDDAQADALRAEILDVFNRFNNSDPDWEVAINRLYMKSASRNSSKFEEWTEFYESGSGILLLIGTFILLLIPALNLSGMISSRMEMRELEMGVRKSFGATRETLLKQVMWENLILTIMGGIVGIFLCWVILYGCKEWVFMMSFEETATITGTEVDITTEMIFAPAVFLFSLGACVALNVMSAYIPAKRALKRPVVEMLNDKK